MKLFKSFLVLLLLALGGAAMANDMYLYRADGMLIKLTTPVTVSGKTYYLYNEQGRDTVLSKPQNMWNMAVVLGKSSAKTLTQFDRSFFMKDSAGNGYSVKLPTESELQAIFSYFRGPPPQWYSNRLEGCCEFWSATRNWNDHSTVNMYNNKVESRWDTDFRVVALEVKPSTYGDYVAETAKPRVLLLHGLFGAGDSIMGSAYFPDLTGWIQEMTGQAPVVPNLGDFDLDYQYQKAVARMKSECPSGCRWHIVGHSRGGLVARMIMEKNPQWVLSITTVSTPHRGCPLCDLTSDSKVVKDFIGLFTSTGAPAQVMEMSQANMDKFNQTYRVGVSDGVKNCSQWRTPPTGYFHSRLNVGGHSIHAASIVGNRFGSTGDEFVAFWSNLFDPTYWMNLFAGAIGADDRKYSSDNDGVVPQCSASFGATGNEGLRLSAVDHNDTVYQLARMSSTRGIDVLKGHLGWLFNHVN